MNAERLLAHSHRIADAPDAVARLRRFVLDLAVRGRLVPQDPRDEPASVLLRRIAAEKTRLAKAGAVRNENPLPPLKIDSPPFELPHGWAWTRLGAVIHLVSGQHLQPPEYSDNPKSGLPYVTGPADFGVNGLHIARFALVRKAVAKRGQLLLTVKGSGVGKTTTCDVEEVAISRQLMALTAISWERRFLPLVTHLLAETLREQAHSLIPGISRESVDEFVAGLPPLAEQHRIVGKVDELMTLCDWLEKTRTEREATRDRLTAASLARLNAPDPDTAIFADHARFALNVLKPLTTRPDQIKQLRQTILNLAVRGKLVPQDPNDEPARIHRVCTDGDSGARLDIAIPRNWQWVRVGQIASARLGKMLDKAKNKGRPYPYLRNTNVHWFDIRLDDVKTIALEADEFEEYRLQRGDVLICEGGHGIGRTATWDGWQDGVVFQKALHRVRPGPHLDPTFFARCCFVYYSAGIMQSYFTGVGIPHFTGKALAKLMFPLPPLAEQHRIVARTNQLIALCDRLEASLATAADTSRRLLEAVLAEGLKSPETGVAGELEKIPVPA